MKLNSNRKRFLLTLFMGIFFSAQSAHALCYKVKGKLYCFPHVRNVMAESKEAFFEITQTKVSCENTIVSKPVLKLNIESANIKTIQKHTSVESSLFHSISECESFKDNLIQSFAPGVTLPYLSYTTHGEHCYPKVGCTYWAREHLSVELEGFKFSNSESIK